VAPLFVPWSDRAVHPRVLAAFLLATAIACGDDGGALGPDAGAVADAAPPDGAATDAAPMFPQPGFGAISGDCDVLDTELTDPAPSYFESAIDFAAAYTEADLDQLTAGGQEIIADGNEGGSSLYSEVFAYEVLARCELAALTHTETEIEYDVVGPITDLRVTIDGLPLGVSVTRAVAFPFEDPYTVEQARDLLEDKLTDILESSANVAETHRWDKQILAVLAYAPGHAESLATAHAALDPSVTADTIVWVVVTNGADDFIY
jgi:hypothetical protein